MIIMLQPDAAGREEIVRSIVLLAARYPSITARPYDFTGSKHSFTEGHLIGSTPSIPVEPFQALPGVLRVVRVSTRYGVSGGDDDRTEAVGFMYNGVRFDDRVLNVIAGLCAVDTRAHVEEMMAALQAEGIVTTRMGAYKPRTSPYDFQ